MSYLGQTPELQSDTYKKEEVDGLLAAGLATKQNTLVSGTNIKTVGGNQLLGSGNLEIQTATPPFTSGEYVDAFSERYSTINLENYRAKSAGTRTIDPSEDPTNWHPIGQTSAQAYSILWALAFN